MHAAKNLEKSKCSGDSHIAKNKRQAKGPLRVLF